MIYFKSAELLYAALASILFGALFGVLYSSIREMYSFLITLLKSIHGAVINCHHISLKRIKISVLNKNKNIKRITKELLDFVFFLSFGCSLILLTYALLDGVLRMFVPITALLTFWIANKGTGIYFSKITKRILDTILITYTFLLEAILHYPIVLIIILKGLIFKVALRFAKSCSKKRSKRIIKKKIKETKKCVETFIK